MNNDNLQSPPYLLEALKQASALDGNAAAQSEAAAAGRPPALDGTRLQTSLGAAMQDSGRHETPGAGLRDGGPASESKLAAVKEETIEELLDLAPDSVLRLSPEAIMNSGSSHKNEPERFEQPQASSISVTRKPQLPVTSSHLKRPAVSVDLLDDGSRPNQMAANASAADSTMSGDASNKGRVSPSVLVEEEPAAHLEKKANAQPPDTLEASQVMQDTDVPATVQRHYGSQTRTRITLGGGYTRNKLPPLVEPPAADFHEDRRPERPFAPIEQPSVAHLSESSSVDAESAATERELGGISFVENSRLVEAPKRIVLPAGAFSNPEEQPAKVVSPTKRPNNANSTAFRRDSRCPANGVTSLEHPSACDKYFLCQDGRLSEQTCPNGLLYGTRNVVRDFCVHRWEAVCGDKSIPNPISSPGCRWQNGIFNVQGSPKCVPDFYECKDGLFEVRKCSIAGQVYDDKTKSCRYAEQVGCTQEALADFRCPADDQTNTYWPFPRYFLNDRALVHCVNDKPEIIRCRDHERVDPINLFCVPIDKSGAATDDESAPEMTARRSTTNGQPQREKAAKPAESQPAAAVAN